MSNLILVGSPDCTILKVLRHLKAAQTFSLFSEKLSDIAIDLETCRATYNRLTSDLLLDKRRLPDAIHDLIQEWVGRRGTEATLREFINVLELNGMTACAQQLRGLFPPPTRVNVDLGPPALISALNDQVPGNVQHIPAENSVVDSPATSVSPLHLAVQNFDLDDEILSMLSTQVDFNIVDGNGDSLLSYAVKGQRSPQAIANLIKYGAQFTTLNNRGRSLLHISALQGTVDSLQFFLDLSELKPDINRGDTDGNTPLHCGVMRIKKEDAIRVCSLLIENGANAHISNSRGQTTLHVASHCSDVRLDVIKFMIDKGVPVDARENVMQKSFLYFLIPRLSDDQFHDITKFLCGKGNANIFQN